MPLLTICTNTDIDHADTFTLEASAFTARLLAKPESYVMVKIETVRTMSFAGSFKAAAHLQLKSLGLAETETERLSAALCQFIEDRLSIPAARIYIEFASPERSMWGWDNHTFGQESVGLNQS